MLPYAAPKILRRRSVLPPPPRLSVAPPLVIGNRTSGLAQRGKLAKPEAHGSCELAPGGGARLGAICAGGYGRIDGCICGG
mmetsp:Transcript_9114/g.22653  ORF Transcript_9114/g.22653 Transcript_9114/m.22653 type:complete len:81 (+) Transcript_9114:183-425(+)